MTTAEPTLPPRTVAAYIPDLLFGIRVADAIRAQGGVPDMADSANSLWEAIQRWPVLVLIDLTAPGDWRTVVQRAKNLPHTRRIPIVAFGSHLDTAALKAARQAGADHAWARSHFVEQLPDLVKSHLAQPPQFLAGWDDTPSALAFAGFEAFNAGHYWEQHELLEHAWNAEPRAVRELYQGILQVGVALHQIEQGKWAGAIKLMRRGLNRLDPLPAVCMGVDLDSFRRQAHIVHWQLLECGAERLAEIDRTEFPRIVFADQTVPQPGSGPNDPTTTSNEPKGELS